MRKIVAFIVAASVAILAVGCAPSEEGTNNGPEKGKGAIENKGADSKASTANPTASQ